MIQKFLRILLILGMTVVICGIASAAMGIVAETHETSGASEPACTAPCECISLTEAMHRWGTDGYDYCSKTVCGQSADAMTQYYCLHQSGSSAAAPAQAQAPVAAATKKSPVNAAVILAAVGISLLAVAVLRKK